MEITHYKTFRGFYYNQVHKYSSKVLSMSLGIEGIPAVRRSILYDSDKDSCLDSILENADSAMGGRLVITMRNSVITLKRIDGRICVDK